MLSTAIKTKPILTTPKRNMSMLFMGVAAGSYAVLRYFNIKDSMQKILQAAPNTPVHIGLMNTVQVIKLVPAENMELPCTKIDDVKKTFFGRKLDLPYMSVDLNLHNKQSLQPKFNVSVNPNAFLLPIDFSSVQIMDSVNDSSSLRLYNGNPLYVLGTPNRGGFIAKKIASSPEALMENFGGWKTSAQCGAVMASLGLVFG